MDARTGIGRRLFVLCPWVRAIRVAGVFDSTTVARLGIAEAAGSGAR
jgi:hypothetical protein